MLWQQSSNDDKMGSLKESQNGYAIKHTKEAFIIGKTDTKSNTNTMITEEELIQIEQRVNSAQAGPWKAYIEDRDHESGSSFIMTGSGEHRGEDIEMIGATNADYDFIANARQDIPRLIEEIRRLQRK